VIAVFGILVILGCADRSDEEAKAGLPVLNAQPDLRIDGNEHDLVPITWLGVSPAGQIALIQWQDYTVRFFSPSGAPLESVGREGEGPGEFRRPLRGGWFGDTLWVHDTQINRVTLIDPGQKVVGMFTPPATVQASAGEAGARTLYSGPFLFGMLSRDSMIVTSLRAVDGPAISPASGYPIMVMTVDGVLARELMRLPFDEGASVSIALERGTAAAAIPFFARSNWTVAPNGRMIAILTSDMSDLDAPSYRIRVLDASGSELANRVFPFAPEPIPAPRMDSAIEAASARRPEVRAQLAEKLRSAAPKIYAAAERVLIGSDGRIWVGLKPEPDGRPWLVLGPRGDPIGRVVLPGNVVLQAASESQLWAVERDELDVESVVRYRLVPANR
jgi:hypothetical protein